MIETFSKIARKCSATFDDTRIYSETFANVPMSLDSLRRIFKILTLEATRGYVISSIYTMILNGTNYFSQKSALQRVT